jgi:lysylphosphatidylglycerol synthetase-like protein (DUF2156 family)
LLVFEALQSLKQMGAELATLGTAPLASDGENEISNEHPVVAKALQLAAKRFTGFYNFEGLRRFKGKFAPSWWESEYVVAQRGVAIPPRVAHAIIHALIPRGLPQLLTRQALRLVRVKYRPSLRKTVSPRIRSARVSRTTPRL